MIEATATASNIDTMILVARPGSSRSTSEATPSRIALTALT
ncbi:hypothetical protein [Reyranella sp.]